MWRGSFRTACAMALLVVPALALAGCTGSDGTVGLANPLPNPKVLLYEKPGVGFEMYVHGAVRERSYDRITVLLNNETLADVADTYASIVPVSLASFRLGILVVDGTTTYAFEGDVLINATAGTALIAEMPAGSTEAPEPQEVKLPWSKIVDREVANR